LGERAVDQGNVLAAARLQVPVHGGGVALFKDWRRERLRALPFPAEWQRIIERNVAAFGRLSPEDQRELLGHTQVLLAEKHFEGCGGLELTDEIRVTVAAQACILLLHRATDYYPRLTSILVYPSAYLVPGERPIGGGLWEESDEIRLGHTAPRLGALVVAWDDALRGGRAVDDGDNVVFHEFAHQLDFEDYAVDGTPLLESRQYRSWARVMSAEYEALRRASNSGEPTLIDQYGAKNPAEFFAVITELFFERPRELRGKHPALYDELRSFYHQDPATWQPGDGSSIAT
jgi:Mlc titration factor MtfA (ptsG expression regulator)